MAYLFIIALEIVFLSLKQKNDIKSTELFQRGFCYTAYVDGATFLLKDENSVSLLKKVFYKFSQAK